MPVRRKKKSIVQALSNDDDDDEPIVTPIDLYPQVRPVEALEGIPFGLELLADTEHIFIRPQETRDEKDKDVNHYDIIDCDKGKIYFAWEIDLKGSLKVMDFGRRPVLEITNYHSCLSTLLKCLCCVGSTGVTVTCAQPDGSKLGQLVQKYNGCTPKFVMKDEFNKPVMMIKGPEGITCCFNNCNLDSMLLKSAEFPILSLTGEKVGCIMKESQDYSFGIKFNKDISVSSKAILLGAVFAINFLYFDRPQQSSDLLEQYEDKIDEVRKQKRRESYKRDMEYLGLSESGLPSEANDGK